VTAASGPTLLANLLHFAGLLRALGFSISTQQVMDLADGLTCVDMGRRDDVFYTAQSLLVRHPEDRDWFAQAFDLFWLHRLQWSMELGAASRRVEQPALDDLETPEQQAVRPDDTPPDDEDDADGEDEDAVDRTDITSTYSATERLFRKDFAAFSEDELAAARRVIEALVWQLNDRLTRRLIRAAKRDTHLDLRRSLRHSLHHGGEIVDLKWRKRKRHPRPLVVICDISGSMEQYARLFLHFMYTLVQTGQPIEAFVFGTRLTRLTTALRHRDLDTALGQASLQVVDWSGGTRIGESLRTFNYSWARRVLRRGAITLVISDGWDRGDVDLLRREIARLSRSTSHLVWLNPLAGRDDYEPLVRGIQAALPYVDDFLPLHNLHSLEHLAAHLGTLTLR